MKAYVFIAALVSWFCMVSFLLAESEEGMEVDVNWSNGQTALADGLAELALEKFDKIDEAGLSKSEKSVLAWAKVEGLVRVGKGRQALKELEQLEEGELRTFWVAVAHAQLGEFEEAASMLLTGERFEDGALQMRAWLLAAFLYEKKLRVPEKAREVYTEIITKGGADRVYVRQAILRLAAMEVQEGESNFALEALDLWNEGEGSLLEQQVCNILRVQALQMQERYDEAMEVLKEGDVENKGESGTLSAVRTLVLAEILYKKGEKQRAVETLLLNLKAGNSLEEVFFRSLEYFCQGEEKWIPLLEEQLADWLPKEGGELASGTKAREALWLWASVLKGSRDVKNLEASRRAFLRLAIAFSEVGRGNEASFEAICLAVELGMEKQGEEELKGLLERKLSKRLRARVEEFRGISFAQKSQWAEAQAAFQKAREILQKEENETLVRNEILSSLAKNKELEIGQLLALLDEENQVDLALDRFLAMHFSSKEENLVEVREGLERFLEENKESSRVLEAQLALLENYTRGGEVGERVAKIESLLGSLKISDLGDDENYRVLMVLYELRYNVVLGEGFVEKAGGYLEAYPDSDYANELSLLLAQHRFEKEDYNEARVCFQRLAEKNKGSSLGELALYFAARAALEVPTPEAPIEAIGYLEEVIEGKGELAKEAIILRAKTLLHGGKYEETIKSLEGVEGEDASMMRAFALGTMGALETKYYEEALGIYLDLIKNETLNYALSNQIHYFIGQLYEKRKQPSMALKYYYKVISFENRAQEEAKEWVYYYKCGFQAISMLENAERWDSAYKVARRLAASKGPDAERAIRKANYLELEHMLWEPRFKEVKKPEILKATPKNEGE